MNAVMKHEYRSGTWYCSPNYGRVQFIELAGPYKTPLFNVMTHTGEIVSKYIDSFVATCDQQGWDGGEVWVSEPEDLPAKDLAHGYYTSGFFVGDEVEFIPGIRTYNTHISITRGDTARVIEPPNAEGWPDGAVQLRLTRGGQGAFDAAILRKIVHRVE